jgi:hypothetical protein
VAPHEQRRTIQGDFQRIADTVAHGVSPSRAARIDSIWDRWCAFCATVNLDPYLRLIQDPVPALLLFAHRYRHGSIAPSGAPVGGRTVAEAVRAVGQTMALLGEADPRLTPSGQLDFRLQRLLACYTKDDPPPWRVQPVSPQLLAAAVTLCRRQHTPALDAAADMLILAFFFLLRPGEYSFTRNTTTPSPHARSTPFRLCDTHFAHDATRLPWDTSTEAQLRSSTYAALEFTMQKNGVRGERIGLSRSGDPSICPVATLATRVLSLRRAHAPPTTPLYTYYDRGQPRHITSTLLTRSLRAAVIHLQLPIAPTDISARSLRAGGATALFCANVDTIHIQLHGRWRSDEHLRYLHLQATPKTANFAALMWQEGHFAIHPNNNL